jgi:glycine cleavage system H protein
LSFRFSSDNILKRTKKLPFSNLLEADLLVKVGDYEVKEGLYYGKEHFWAKIEGNTIRTGATDYGQKSLREVVYVELPTAGTQIKQGEAYGTVESVKAVVDLIAPFSGTIEAVNEVLRDNPEAINSDPYGEGWLITIAPSNMQSELKNLMDFNAATAFHEEIIKKG